jgi:hypothetical protein
LTFNINKELNGVRWLLRLLKEMESSLNKCRVLVVDVRQEAGPIRWCWRVAEQLDVGTTVLDVVCYKHHFEQLSWRVGLSIYVEELCVCSSILDSASFFDIERSICCWRCRVWS